MEYFKRLKQKHVSHKGHKSTAEKNAALTLPQKRTLRYGEAGIAEHTMRTEFEGIARAWNGNQAGG